MSRFRNEKCFAFDSPFAHSLGLLRGHQLFVTASVCEHKDLLALFTHYSKQIVFSSRAFINDFLQVLGDLLPAVRQTIIPLLKMNLQCWKLLDDSVSGNTLQESSLNRARSVSDLNKLLARSSSHRDNSNKKVPQSQSLNISIGSGAETLRSGSSFDNIRP